MKTRNISVGFGLLLASPLVAALALAPRSSTGQPADPCTRCQPAEAEWGWKANGYAVAATPEEARTLAQTRATDSACKQSEKYLAPQKLRCKHGCDPGEVSQSCAPSKEPACTHGTHADKRDMWTFVCRKFHQDDGIACDDAEAQKSPGFSMCDVSTKAVKSLACAHPDCPP